MFQQENRLLDSIRIHLSLIEVLQKHSHYGQLNAINDKYNVKIHLLGCDVRIVVHIYQRFEGPSTFIRVHEHELIKRRDSVIFVGRAMTKTLPIT